MSRSSAAASVESPNATTCTRQRSSRWRSARRSGCSGRGKTTSSTAFTTPLQLNGLRSHWMATTSRQGFSIALLLPRSFRHSHRIVASSSLSSMGWALPTCPLKSRISDVRTVRRWRIPGSAGSVPSPTFLAPGRCNPSPPNSPMSLAAMRRTFFWS